MPEPFSKTFHVRWGDVDSNAHMRNTAYLDLCVDVRMMFFAEHGFSMREFERLRFGPVVMKGEIEYSRELRLLETVTVTLELAALNADVSRFRLRNEFFNADGQARRTRHQCRRVARSGHAQAHRAAGEVGGGDEKVEKERRIRRPGLKFFELSSFYLEHHERHIIAWRFAVCPRFSRAHKVCDDLLR